MKQLEQIIAEKDQEIAAIKAKAETLEKTLETIHAIYYGKIKKAVKAERMRAEERYKPWKPVYPGD